jgi:hypothetical protein
MNIDHFSKWMIGIGAVIVFVGILMYVNNQPASYSDDLLGSIKSALNNHESVVKEQARVTATYVMGFGAVIAVSGVAVLFSSRRG